jgi:hypothetical protein
MCCGGGGYRGAHGGDKGFVFGLWGFVIAVAAEVCDYGVSWLYAVAVARSRSGGGS